MTTPTQPPAEGSTVARLYTGLRVFGIVVLLLMLLSIVYSTWIAIENWGSISV